MLAEQPLETVTVQIMEHTVLKSITYYCENKSYIRNLGDSK